jgi:hypothetical protein
VRRQRLADGAPIVVGLRLERDLSEDRFPLSGIML